MSLMQQPKRSSTQISLPSSKNLPFGYEECWQLPAAEPSGSAQYSTQDQLFPGSP